jgi:hypothetical protein
MAKSKNKKEWKPSRKQLAALHKGAHAKRTPKQIEALKKYQWKDGESGNRAGRPKAGWAFADLIREFGDKEIPKKYQSECSELCKEFGNTWKHGLVAMMYKFALDGHSQFASYLIERVDGKASLVSINNETNVQAVIVLPEVVETPVEEIEVGQNILQLPPVNGNGNGHFNGNGHNGHSDLLDRP